MTSDPVSFEVTGDVARVTLADPEGRNVLDAETTDGLVAAVDAAVERGARCLVLAAEGPAFCAGGDLSAMADAAEADRPPAERVDRVIRAVNRAVRRVGECPVPTVAAVDGAASGAGAGLVIACDVQLASPDAKIGFGFRRVGLPVYAGVSRTLPRLVGDGVAKELVFTGDFVDADRARELGLFTRVFERDSFEAGVENVVEAIASGPPVALRASKRLLEDPADSLATATEREATAQAAAFGTADHQAAVDAFLAGRDPTFEGR